MEKPKISIIGTGYVGLGTAVSFASQNFKVIAVEENQEKVDKIKKAIPPFHEPELPEKLKKTIQTKNLECLHKNIQKAINQTHITFVTVGTPSQRNKQVNLKYIKKASQSLGKALNKKSTYHLIVIRSTVVPGTTQTIIKEILEKYSKKTCGKDFGLCMNPEFLRQGSAFQDTFHTDRVVIGEYDKKSGDTLEELYRQFYQKNPPPIIRTSLSTAELIKYASNAMLATKISFINTIANITEKIPGADIKTIQQAMGLDSRIGPKFLDAGIGYGGSCFPKDVKALIACSKKLGYKPKLLECVEKINQTQPLKTVELCKQHLNNLNQKNIAILGLAFKPCTDDMREARSIPIINHLLTQNANITVYDPAATENAKKIYQNKIKYATTPLECIKNAHCAIIVTEWPQIKKLTPKDFQQNMKNPLVIDGRRAFNPKTFSKTLKYHAIGLGKFN